MKRSAQLRLAEAEQHTPDYRTVAVYWTLAEAELARGLLASDGIPVASLDAVDAALLPGTSPVRLLVPARDLDRSRLLLDGSPPAPAADAVGVPVCGGADAAWCKLALVLVGLAVLFAALVAL